MKLTEEGKAERRAYASLAVEGVYATETKPKVFASGGLSWCNITA
jgi:hypothetical protein